MHLLVQQKITRDLVAEIVGKPCRDGIKEVQDIAYRALHNRRLKRSEWDHLNRILQKRDRDFPEFSTPELLCEISVHPIIAAHFARSSV